jgi:hypothetical protein
LRYRFAPLWDGNSTIAYRLATSKEEDDFNASFWHAISNGQVRDTEEESFLYWLADIDPDELDEEQRLSASSQR